MKILRRSSPCCKSKGIYWEPYCWSRPCRTPWRTPGIPREGCWRSPPGWCRAGFGCRWWGTTAEAAEVVAPTPTRRPSPPSLTASALAAPWRSPPRQPAGWSSPWLPAPTGSWSWCWAVESDIRPAATRSCNQFLCNPKGHPQSLSMHFLPQVFYQVQKSKGGVFVVWPCSTKVNPTERSLSMMPLAPRCQCCQEVPVSGIGFDSEAKFRKLTYAGCTVWSVAETIVRFLSCNKAVVCVISDKAKPSCVTRILFAHTWRRSLWSN